MEKFKKRPRFIPEAMNKPDTGKSKTLSLQDVREQQGNQERKRKPILSHKDSSKIKKDT